MKQMARKNVRYKLKCVSDREWTCEVPDDMLPVYLSIPDSYDSDTKEYRGIPQKYTDEELEVLRELYPEWWVIKD